MQDAKIFKVLKERLEAAPYIVDQWIKEGREMLVSPKEYEEYRAAKDPFEGDYYYRGIRLKMEANGTQDNTSSSEA